MLWNTIKMEERAKVISRLRLESRSIIWELRLELPSYKKDEFLRYEIFKII